MAVITAGAIGEPQYLGVCSELRSEPRSLTGGYGTDRTRQLNRRLQQ
ncbi:hypothetical protein [Natrinema limicola]|nr:hypothetical protein [Natrinema limicola]